MPAIVYAALAGLGAGMIPVAVLVAKVMGLPDPRSYGSGNPGATNVMRGGSKFAGRLVFVLDFAKGLAPALACEALLDPPGMGAVAAFAAVAAHAWNPFLRLRGGRGVATGLGGLLGFDWQLGALAVALWLLVYSMSKTVSLASVFAFLGAMLLAAWLYPFGSYHAAGAAGIAMVVVIRHRQHLSKLAAGGDDRFAAVDTRPRDKDKDADGAKKDQP